jgi:energy-coupling factor transporter transmembrane protein EcfT
LDPAVALPPLRDLVDARVRIVATGVVIAAALVAGSLLAALVVVAACAVLVRLARIDRSRVRLAVRPLVALTVLLVALQLLVGGDDVVDLRRGAPLEHPVGPALLRALQAAAIVLVTLVLSAATTTLDLAAALRRLLAPLGLVRVPVASLAFVLATGLGLVPAMSDELERLRLAQRARRIRRADAGLVARLRADAAIVGPLFVAAFRRAHRLADALAVRGVDPRRPTQPWRPMRVPSSDLQLLAAGIVLLVVARFA